MCLRRLAVVVAAFIGVAAWIGPWGSSAYAFFGLFEDPPTLYVQPPRLVAPRGGGFRVTVRPRKAFRRQARVAEKLVHPRWRAAQPTRHPVPAAAASKSTRIARASLPLDEKWYLNDASLRRGDIVVLKNGAIVYDGSSKKTHAEEDFVPADKTRLVSTGRVQELYMMISGIWRPDPAAKPGPNASRQARVGATR